METNPQESTTVGAPSAWVVRFGETVTPQCSVLDVACGRGRHARWFAARGHAVTAVDRETTAAFSPEIEFVEADIEAGPWPFAARKFGCVVVTNYLHRPLFPLLLDAVDAGGWLIYETFAVGHEKHGRPTRADFLLKSGELIKMAHGTLEIAAYEHGFVDSPAPAVVQRIAAWRPMF